MLAAFIVAKEQIEVRDIESPTLNSGDILVRMRACGICGSDLHAYRGELPARPSIPCGHEIAGDVIAKSSDATGLREGDRVALAASTGCGRCHYCHSGAEHLCPQRNFLGMTYPGGMAECVRVPAHAAHKIPEELDYDLGALAEPLAVPVHGLHLIGLRPGERALVLGAGAMGLLTILAIKAMNASEVLATYRHDHQAAAAQAVGADAVYAATDDGLDELRREVLKRPVDLVIETVGGQADTLEQAIGLVRPGGRLLALGVFSRPKPLSLLSMGLKEIIMLSSLGYCRSGVRSDMEIALQLLQTQPARAGSIISHRLPLEQAADAFRIAAHKSSGSLKVQVVLS